MITIVMSVIGLFAVFSWIVALISAIQIVSLAPKGQKLRTYMQIGWWKFSDIRSTIGPAADQPIRTYQRAFIGFFIVIILSVGASILLAAQAKN